MPTYEYACGACAHQWEEVQRITEAPTETCPACGKPTAHRLISAGTNFILKGSGWYSDLYASPKPAAAAGGGSEKSETKADTKSDAGSSGSPSTGGDSSGSKPAGESPATPAKTPSSAA